MATLFGWKTDTLSHEVSPNNPAKLGLERWCQIYDATTTHKEVMADAIADRLAVLWAPRLIGDADVHDLMSAGSDMTAEVGDVARALNKILKGSKQMDARQFEALQVEVSEAIRSLMILVQMAKATMHPMERAKVDGAV